MYSLSLFSTKWLSRRSLQGLGTARIVMFHLSTRFILAIALLLGFFVLRNGQFLVVLILPGLLLASLLLVPGCLDSSKYWQRCRFGAFRSTGNGLVLQCLLHATLAHEHRHYRRRPGGSLCASRLSRNGQKVLLFDPRGAWEKPCGGGVTSKSVCALSLSAHLRGHSSEASASWQ